VSFITCTSHQTLLGLSNQGRLHGQVMQHAWVNEKCTQILVGKLERKKRRRWEDMDLKGTGCGLYYQAQDMDQWRVLVTTVSGCIRGG